MCCRVHSEGNRLKVSLIGGINLAVRCVAESIPSCNRLKVSLIGGINLAVRCVAESIPSCNRLKVSLIGGINLAVRCVAESIPSCNRLKVSFVNWEKFIIDLFIHKFLIDLHSKRQIIICK